MTLPRAETVASMLFACTTHYQQLITGGCSKDVALDRTWDAYTCALNDSPVQCFDPRDRLFEGKLRTIRERGA